MTQTNTGQGPTQADAVATTAEDPIYGGRLGELESELASLIQRIDRLRAELRDSRGEDPMVHCLGRVKTPQSIREKCLRKGLEPSAESAFAHVRDIIGVRVVCAFLSDVYLMRDAIARLPGAEVVGEKDYIRHVKPNGYRSYHLLLRLESGLFAEVQVRTVSMDTWASLEHQLKYKRDLDGDLRLITSELKRCADELASTDLSMQAIRDMIRGERAAGGEGR